MTVEQWLNAPSDSLNVNIWKRKYQYGDETFDDWVDRVSGGNQDIKQLILDKKFLFGGRILANRGLPNDRKVCYSNCFVMQPPEDNIESIFETAKQMARTYSYGGGVGLDLSKLRPRGTPVHNSAKTSTGAVSFMDTYSKVTEVIAAEGRVGALMISLDCNHPDIEEFIDVKTDLNRVTKANISIRFSDDFMKAVDDNAPVTLSYKLEDGQVITKKVDARAIMEKLAKNNWNFAEPGCLFWDTIKGYNMLNTYEDFEFAGVNPCGEEPLGPNCSCLLGSLNLSEFVQNPFTSVATFDTKGFATAVQQAVVGLNEVLKEGIEKLPLPAQKEATKDWMPIGLGIMGLADALIKLGIPYGSAKAVNFCDIVGNTMARSAVKASITVAATQHSTFRKFKPELTINSNFISFHFNHDIAEDAEVLNDIRHTGMANSQLLTIAPTGTISTMLGISGGIEPIFAPYYDRKTESLHGEEKHYRVYTPIFKEGMEALGIKEFEDLPDYFICAHDINWKDRIAMQSMFQDHIDASISSTINLPHDTTPEEVYELYMTAWRQGLKGVTVYRDGCARGGVLTTDTKKEEEEVEKRYEPQRGDIIAVNNNVIGLKRKLHTGCGTLHVMGFFDRSSGLLTETFFTKGSTGGCERNLDGLSRMISLSCRGGINIEDIIDQLNSVMPCPAYMAAANKGKASPGTCCPSAIGKALLDMYNEIQNWLWDEENNTLTVNYKEENPEQPNLTPNKCPECGEVLTHEGGCVQCSNCGWSRCS